MPAPTHILVLDDDPAMLLLFQELLTEEGYEVSARPAQMGALSLLHTLAPDLLLLDWRGRGGSASLTLLRALRADPGLESLPVVLCSAAVEVLRDLAPILASLNVAVVPKPFDINQLLARIASQLSPASSATDHGEHGYIAHGAQWQEPV